MATKPSAVRLYILNYCSRLSKNERDYVTPEPRIDPHFYSCLLPAWQRYVPMPHTLLDPGGTTPPHS